MQGSQAAPQVFYLSFGFAQLPEKSGVRVGVAFLSIEPVSLVLIVDRLLQRGRLAAGETQFYFHALMVLPTYAACGHPDAGHGIRHGRANLP